MRWILVFTFLMPVIAIADDACPSGFEQFLEKFESDRVFQQAHIKNPLKYTFLDYQAQPEPKKREKQLGQTAVARLKEAIFPLRPMQSAHGLSLRKIKELPSHQMWVQLAKPDTGYQLDFYFERTAVCWTLAEYSDLSM
ncbi:MAG: hypothetical protein ABL896_09645 [Hylemonella sp.]